MTVDINDCGEISATICVTGVHAWSLRTWLMLKLFAIGAWVAPRNIKVEIKA